MDYDVIILGGGPGGAAAGQTLARLGHRTLILDREGIGAGVRSIGRIENLPGWPGPVSGPLLAEQLAAQVAQSGAAVRHEEAQGVWNAGCGKTVLTDQGRYTCAAVVAAMGVAPDSLAVPGAARLTGKGIYSCAFCDGLAMAGLAVGVAGGGAAAGKAALFLAERAARVYLIHQGAALAADKQPDVMRHPRIEIKLNTAITGVRGDRVLEGVEINTGHGGRMVLALNALFVYIGGRPDLALFREHVRIDRHGFILTGPDCSTSVPGLYAVGAVRCTPVSQVVGALSDGVQAAFAVSRYLATHT
jgi:thioredoxin reductase (NADPH)